MNRPLYERSHDLEAEREVISAVASSTGTRAVKLPIAYHVDYMMMGAEGVRAWVEVKRRKNQKSKYPTFFLSLNKVIHGLTLAQSSGRPFFVAVRWDDTDPELLRVTGLEGLRLEPGGRTDRQDDQDVEPMVHWPIELFRALP